MKCANCGAELVDGAKFCGSCGTPVVASTVQETVESSLPKMEAPQVKAENPIPDMQTYVQQPTYGGSNAEALPMKNCIWALILGIAGLGSFWTSFMGPFGFISIVICIIGLIIGGKAKKENPANKMGRTGWILSLIGLILGGILTIIFTIAWATAFRYY